MTSCTSPWPMMLAASLLLSAAGLPAFALDPPSRSFAAHNGIESDPPQKVSHIPIDISGDRDSRLQDALQKIQKGKQLSKLIGKLKDEKLLDELKDSVTPEMLEKLQHGEVSGDLSAWQPLLDAVKDTKQLTPEDKKLLEDLVKERTSTPPLGSPPPPLGTGKQPTPDQGKRPPPPSSPTTPKPSQDSFDQAQKSLGDWLRDQVVSGAREAMDYIEDIDGGSSARSLRNTIQRLKNLDLSDGPSRFSVTNRLGDLNRFAPRLNELLANRPDFSELTSLFHGAHLPDRPRLSGALPRVSGRSMSGLAAGLFWLLIPVVLVLLAWTFRAGARRLAENTEPVWRLGPWPVRPTAVSTRDELIRAFEYLAFLCLGPDARTCNHREVAERLAEQPDAAPERRRDAAWELAQYYEEARYASVERPLSAADWANVRRDLCLLAGVPSA